MRLEKIQGMKIALLVIYNHRYDKNIPRIEKLYQGRFSNIFHLVPFYDGDLSNVIPVYESSYYFQSYIAQAYRHIKGLGFTHYFCVPDDMIINPAINENNLFDLTGIPETHCYIHNFIMLHGGKKPWTYKYNAYRYNPNPKGLEISNVLPPYETAMGVLTKKGYCPNSLSFAEVLHDAFWALTHKRLGLLYQIVRTFFTSKKLRYPLVGGWSDILLLTDNIMPVFCQYCGAFAASNLFVEIALPSALLLCAENITTSESIILKNNIPLITLLPKDQQVAFYRTYDYKLDKLMEEYPSDRFFVHPIKLSQWK